MFRHSFRFGRALALVKPYSKPHLRRLIIGATGAVILASSLKTIHGDTQPLNRPPKDFHSSEDSKPQRPTKDDPSDRLRKSLDKLRKNSSDLPDDPGSDHAFSALKKINEDLELLGKAVERFQKSIEALGKDTNAPQTDDDHVHQALTTHAASFIPDTQSGVARFDSVVVPSNVPSEDHISSTFCHLPTHSWSIFGVFDGHNGPATSHFLNSNLLNAIIGALADLYSKHAPITREHTELATEPASGRPEPPPEEIDRTIKETFLRVDDEIVNWAVERALNQTSKEAAVNLLATAHAGSCALVGFYESDTRLFRVALTGDSRAVLGRKKASKKGKETYEVHVLSQDQNAHNPAEEARMSALHPGEKIMDNGRVLGWGMSRAFGDAAYKWSREIQQRLAEEFLGDRVRENVKTPPYFTAEPEITTTEVQPGDFVVLATDGLWDCLTNEEVVGLVGVWLDRQKEKKSGSEKVWEREELPVKLEEDKTVMYPWWRAKKRFIDVDNNVAVHLVRNALGGADRDLTTALLYLEPPRSRRYRDDISVQVVLFQ